MKKKSKSNLSQVKGWSIKLKVTPEQEKKIKKEAIDLEMRVPEYILLKVLGNSRLSTEGK